MIPAAIFIGGVAAICAIRWASTPRWLRRCRACGGIEFDTRAHFNRHRRLAHHAE